ncbi:UDP-glucose 4-epimerase GalE [Kyrpidia spormannii]|uniref:UDP-glucose 4-epimerase GalE n=1 Tax=Kyrpidia spormannii TaxID=2055160 RepID=UPI0018E4D849|nr:UDP-glucose 4-epimerase GalE [Kyrpidia spormannii]
MDAVLVSGGAGYIGSHVVKRLVEAGRPVVVMDNETTGHRETVGAVEELTGWRVPYITGDVGDGEAVRRTVEEYRVGAVMHFAAKSVVAESVRNPEVYFTENVAKGIAFFRTLCEAGVRRIVLSSTAAVYGNPERVPIPEDHPVRPINPYGASKIMLEQVLGWLETTFPIRWVALRYFNAAGADPSGRLGERHDPETHLIPIVLQAVLGQRERMTVFGTDYGTPDGTCIRDYIHVLDLADAHLLALAALEGGHPSGVFNVGTGRGHSVLEVIRVAEEVSGRTVPVEYGARRPGDPPVLVADGSRLRELGWKPRYGLWDIVASAWAWHSGDVGDAPRRV